MAKGFSHITPAQMDLVIKLAFGPRKLGSTEIGKQLGMDRTNVNAVIRAYTLTGEGDLDVIAEKLATKSITMSAVEWAFDYHGKAVPEDLKTRVEAKKRAEAFPAAEMPAQKKTEEDNLLVLCGRLNALGMAISDCLTEKTAAVLVEKLVAAVADLKKDMNANADALLKEMEAQRMLLEKIAYNTKKLKKGGAE